MKQLSVLSLSLALMFSLSGCCGLFGHGGGYGAGYPGYGGGCNGNQSYPAFYNGGAVAPGGAGNCGPGGCGVSYPNAIYNGSAAVQPGVPVGPVAYVPTPALQTY